MNMDVEELEPFISTYAVDILREKGIKKLFPPQEDVINLGLFSKKNFVIAVPTASGKTLLAELAMIREIMEGGKCLYIVPLRALAVEKYEEFQKWDKIGVKTSYSIGDFESREEALGDSDIIVTTSEKADSFLRNGASWIKKITCVIIDEIHLLDSGKRGPVVEIIVAKFRKINPEVRFIALSATIPNADEISGWLNAELYFSDWRPTKLYEGVYSNGVLELTSNGEIETKEIGRGDISVLTVDCLREGGQVLIFDSTRRNAEATAKRLSTVTMKFINPNENEDIAKKILEENEGEMSRNLADCIRLGSAFHHAGLLNSQRKIVEDAFRDGRIKVVVSTPTLSAGVNLPARRVIIKSYYRFEGYGSVPIKVMEYKQMAGRAGRPGMDPRGEAILVVRNKSEKSSVFERYIFGRPEDIESKLGAETHLRFHTLSLISEEFARTMDELIEFFSDTFFFYQNQVSPVFEIERVVGQLEKWGFIENESGVLLPTSTGSLVSKLYIDPLSGFIFIDCLKRFDDLSEIATLHLICRTPDMEKLYLKKSDDWVEDEAFSVRDELTYYPSGYSIDYDWFLREFKTALCIQEWINEEDEDTICEKFGISPGDLRRIIESAEWLSYSLRRIAENMNYHSNTLKNLDFRIKYGIKGELIDLVGIKGVGRVRARKLYNAGIKSYDDILSNEEKISTILGKKIAENIINEVQRVAGR